jgi:hypothetical protein
MQEVGAFVSFVGLVAVWEALTKVAVVVAHFQIEPSLE